MNLSNKHVGEILKCWNLENESVQQIRNESAGMADHTAFYVGNDFVLKFSSDFEKVKKTFHFQKPF